LFLWSQNLGETNPSQVLLPLAVVVAGAALLTMVLGLLLRDRQRGALVATPVLVGFLMYGHAAHLVARFHVPGLIQQAGWIALIVIAIVAAVRLSARSIATLDRALVRIGAVLVIVTLVLIIPFQVGAFSGRASIPRIEPVSDATAAPKRDVYWLVFDRYGSDRALELQYGVKNDLTPWLQEHGFEVLADSHANYIRTVLSMSTTLQMADLDDVVRTQGSASSDVTTVNELLQDSPVARQFKALGYRYHHIGGAWDPNRNDRGADVNHSMPVVPGTGDFLDALFDTSAIPALAKRLHVPVGSVRERQFLFSEYGLDALDAVRDEPGPKFVQAHILLPHPPLVFDRDGTFIDDATASRLTKQELYERQLAYTNTRLKAFISGLQALPEDERPIIILQADEGPWPPSYSTGRKTSVDWAAQATDDELEQKFGIMNAWYLPEGDDLGLDPAMTAINTFPVLFGRYFGIEYPLLPDRIYASRDWYHPYDLTDITDRLPSLR
jgi:hypothetical protein